MRDIDDSYEVTYEVYKQGYLKGLGPSVHRKKTDKELRAEFRKMLSNLDDILKKAVMQ